VSKLELEGVGFAAPDVAAQVAAGGRFAVHLPEASNTAALGRRLAALLGRGDALCLFGDLGAGKTTLARGVVQAWTQSDEEAPSPTYTLVQTYEGDAGRLSHFDLYRLREPAEVLELGFEEALAEGVCVIEWPERLGATLPANRIELRLRLDGDGRVADIAAFGRLHGAGI
jgi:tRNA threonylcarbamoyladenosine biosynthesis protein TsaE